MPGQARARSNTTKKIFAYGSPPAELISFSVCSGDPLATQFSNVSIFRKSVVLPPLEHQMWIGGFIS